MELLKSLLLGILEGITEWLPVSSTGHLLLFDRFLKLGGSAAFHAVFLYVVQLGAVPAVLVLTGKKIVPFRKGGKNVLFLWGKIAFACVPGAAAAILFGDRVPETPFVIALALLFYGVLFLWIEPLRKKRGVRVEDVFSLSWKDAFLIGLFQVLSIVPGTSRSGATILGALLLGVSRPAAAEFSFLMALPVMAGMSGIKLLQNGVTFSGAEWLLLGAGAFSAFLTSLFTIRFLIGFVKKHSFAAFGVYRIALGAAVLLFLA